MQDANHRDFGWLSIFRLGLVQTALGAVVVVSTSTLNRVMVVELGLAAMVPGLLVTLHYAVQLSRPRMGYGSDLGRRHTPWIVGGMAALAAGGFGAAAATALVAEHPWLGLAAATVAYVFIGLGVGACGTSLLALMAKRVPSKRRGAAATIVWMMMIAGFAITATAVGKSLEPFTYAQLVKVAGIVSLAAFAVAALAMWRLEGASQADDDGEKEEKPAFRQALAQVWAEPNSRRFTAFVFISMLAYSGQDLVLEPFAGAVFGWTPGESTQLAGAQHGGVFAGMLLVAVLTSVFAKTRLGSLKGWVVFGCLGSALAMIGLCTAGLLALPAWPLRENVFVLGVFNGIFSIAAIASMMALAGRGHEKREGTRMGIWGAAQALAFASGGFLGTVVVDVMQWAHGSTAVAYASVFALEAVGFFAAQALASRTRFDTQTESERSVLSSAAVEPSAAPAFFEPAGGKA
ncbi:MAG: BCD family MFS transporter [Myxococcota bacterium]